MTMQTVMFIAQSSGGNDDATVHPIGADEVWDFCSRGFAALADPLARIIELSK